MDFFTQEHSDINGRNVWRHLVATPIGNINIVQYEKVSKEIITFLYDENLEAAEKKYKSIIKAIIGGKL